MSVHETSQGWQWLLGIGIEDAEAPGEAVAPTAWVQIASESLADDLEEIDAEGMHGARSHNRQRSTTGKHAVGGQVVIDGFRAEIADLLMRMATGDTSPAAGVYELANTLPTATLVVWRGFKRFTYAGCACNTLRLESGQAEQALKATLDVVAMSEATSDVEPEAAYVEEERILCHKDLSLVAGEDTLRPERFSLVIDNRIDADVFRNSANRLAVPPADRIVSGEATVDWNSVADTVYAAFQENAMAALSAEWTDGSNGLAISGDYCQWRGRTPGMTGRGTVTVSIPYQLKASAAGVNDEISVTLTTGEASAS
ncbi:MAG TPA: phage tail tube protein [Phycisphaerae bacterium]|nr:phage tail tube protein [Phycisphaerae bacterium]